MAATGSYHNGKCFADSASAQDAFFSSQPAISTPGATSYVNMYGKNAGGAWVFNQYEVDSVGAWTLRSSTAAATPVFAACDPIEGFTDGMLIGWGIATAMVLVAALKRIQDGAR
jgi:hypothetical protein